MIAWRRTPHQSPAATASPPGEAFYGPGMPLPFIGIPSPFRQGGLFGEDSAVRRAIFNYGICWAFRHFTESLDHFPIAHHHRIAVDSAWRFRNHSTSASEFANKRHKRIVQHLCSWQNDLFQAPSGGIKVTQKHPFRHQSIGTHIHGKVYQNQHRKSTNIRPFRYEFHNFLRYFLRFFTFQKSC